MPSRTFEIACPNEGNNTENEHFFEVEVTMLPGEPMIWGNTMADSYPGSGDEYEWELPTECPECHHVFTEDEQLDLEGKINQEAIDTDWVEDPPEPDYDEDRARENSRHFSSDNLPGFGSRLKLSAEVPPDDKKKTPDETDNERLNREFLETRGESQVDEANNPGDPAGNSVKYD